MPLKDLILNKFTPADIIALNTALQNIETTIANKTVNLTGEERQRYGSINEQNKLFVNKVNDYRISHPQMNSPQVDWVEFQADLFTRNALSNILNKLATLTEQFSDTKILHDNDNYQQSLTQYKYISYLSDENGAGTTSIKDELAQFFPRTNEPSKPSVPPTV
jgi:hypothetical protein